MDSWKSETPLGLRADILRHLGSYDWQVEREGDQVHIRENSASCSEFGGVQAAPLGVFVSARSCVGFLHVWLQT